MIVKNVYPDTFTPNGDGVNDTFGILNASNVRTNFFRIFNRWGHIVFDSRQQGNSWDGTANSKKQPSGTYYWQWDAFDETSRREISRSGQVILIR